MVPLVACGLFALVPSRPDPGALSPAALPLGNADTNANVSAFSVVVPCFSRQGSVHRVLSNLLANTTASEVILVMQSRAVVEDKEGILDRVQRACEDPLRHNGTYRPNGHACDLSKLKVVDNVARNDEIFSASRFFAAAEHATSPVLVHSDDDIRANEKLLRAMVSRVAAAVAAGRTPGLYGPETRACGASGYCNSNECRATDYAWANFPFNNKSGTQIILTDLAATSSEMNALYVQNFERYRDLIVRTRGNGEDLTFNHQVQAAGGERAVVGAITPEYGVLEKKLQSGGYYEFMKGHDGADSYHAAPDHYSLRGAICSCMASGKLEAPLGECVKSSLRKDGLLHLYSGFGNASAYG